MSINEDTISGDGVTSLIKEVMNQMNVGDCKKYLTKVANVCKLMCLKRQLAIMKQKLAEVLKIGVDYLPTTYRFDNNRVYLILIYHYHENEIRGELAFMRYEALGDFNSGDNKFNALEDLEVIENIDVLEQYGFYIGSHNLSKNLHFVEHECFTPDVDYDALKYECFTSSVDYDALKYEYTSNVDYDDFEYKPHFNRWSAFEIVKK